MNPSYRLTSVGVRKFTQATSLKRGEINIHLPFRFSTEGKQNEISNYLCLNTIYFTFSFTAGKESKRDCYRIRFTVSTLV